MTVLAYRYLDEAQAELRAAACRYELARSGLGVAFEQCVQETIARIRRFPESASPWEGLRVGLPVRRALVRRFPFAVAYVIRDDTVVIIAVAHTRRRPAYWLDRLGSLAVLPRPRG